MMRLPDTVSLAKQSPHATFASSTNAKLAYTPMCKPRKTGPQWLPHFTIQTVPMCETDSERWTG
jgi:hypothetical protein